LTTDGPVVAIARSFNEIDIVESSVRRMAHHVDRVIVLDNSGDGSLEVLRELEADLPLEVFLDDEPNFRQREVVTRFAHYAREKYDASWVVPFDLDEIWLPSYGRIRDRLRELPDTILVAPARLLTHACTTEDDRSESDPFERMRWREVEMLPLPKVAARCREDLWIDHGSHSCHFEHEPHPAHVPGILEARHFPYRSAEQFVKRVRGAYPQLKRSGLPRSHGLHMWEYGETLERHGEDALVGHFNGAMCFDNPAERDHLTLDPVPCLVPS
jgi:hypothetical protein